MYEWFNDFQHRIGIAHDVTNPIYGSEEPKMAL